MGWNNNGGSKDDPAKTASIQAQNAGNIAAVVYAGLGVTDWDADLFNEIRKDVLDGTLDATAAATVEESFKEEPAPRRSSSGGSSRGRSSGGRSSGGGKKDPGDIDFNKGKHRGLTISEVYDKDPDYLDWCVDNLENEFLVKVIGEFLDAQ